MPKSVSVSLLVSLAGVLLFAWLRADDPSGAPSREDYIAVAVNLFNASALISLFVILYVYEKQTDAVFGQAMRANIATVIVAMLINLVGTSLDVADLFLP